MSVINMSSSCSYCHAPQLPKKEFHSFCSYGCQFLFSLAGANKIWYFAQLGLVVIFFLIMIASKYQQKLIFGRIEEGVFLGATGLLFLLGVSLIKSLFSSKQAGKFRWGIIIILLSVFIDYGFSVYRVSFLEISPSISYLDTPPFFLSGFILFISFFILLFISFSRRLAHKEIWNIQSVRPLKARKVFRKQFIETNVSDLKEGDLIQIEPGELIPCDGVIVSGTTSVDESKVTAESSTFLKSKGDKVLGASLNRDGTIVIEVVSLVDKHFLETMIGVIQHSMAPSKSMGWWSAKKFFLFTFISCFLFIGIRLVVRQKSFEVLFFELSAVLALIGFYNLIHLDSNLLALAVGKIARNGILIRSSEVFKKIAAMNYIFFEKTGTLTKGDYLFSHFFLERGVNQGALLSTLFSLEAHSNHPLAKGAKTHPWYPEFSLHHVEGFKAHHGVGICGTICERGRPKRFAAVGNMRFLKRFQMQISHSLRTRLEELESIGDTVVLCGWEGSVRGLISFADTLRPDVKPLMMRLKKLKVKPVMMTGDHGEMISHLTYAHGLEQIYIRCLPEEKANKIKNQQQKGAVVGVVGDFIGDSNSLDQADVGMIFQGGDNLFNDKADVIILGKRLLRVTDLILFSRKVYRRFKLKSFMSFFSIIALLSCLAFGVLGPKEVILFFISLSLCLSLFSLTLTREQFEK